MKGYAYKLLLGLLILLQVFYTVYAFTNWKHGAHSDEVWSYGLSNSYYQSFLDIRQGAYEQYYTYDDVINHDTWVSGEYLKDYITVQSGEQFAYDSVYVNNTFDVHPPLYYMVMHTICSCFPERFSWWYGFVLNLLCLIGTQIFLFLTVNQIAQSEETALITCLFYGGSKGALLTFTFIRQYSMLTMLCMLFVYCSTCFYEKVMREGKFSRKYQVLAATSAGLTFLTHYYGVIFVGVFTAGVCIYLLLKKKWGEMFSYGLGILLALVCFFAIYPVAVYHYLMAQEEVITAYSPTVQIRMLLSYLFRYNYGFEIEYFPTAFWNITLPLVGAALVAAAALLIPFRDEPWFPKLLQTFKNMVFGLCNFLRRADYVPVFAIAGGIVIYKLVAKSVDVWLSGIFVMRYTSMVIPFAAMATVLLTKTLLDRIPKTKPIAHWILLVIVCGVLIRVHLTTGYPYTHRQICGNVNILEETQGKNVLVVDRLARGIFTDMNFFTPELYKANSVCITSSESITEKFLGGENNDNRRIDYIIADTEAFRLSDQEKRELEIRGDVSFAPEDASEHPFACTELIKEIAGSRPYRILSIWQGQTGVYYILKFE